MLFGEREENTKFLIAQSWLAIEVGCSPFDRGPGIEDMSVTSQAPNNRKQQSALSFTGRKRSPNSQVHKERTDAVIEGHETPSRMAEIKREEWIRGSLTTDRFPGSKINFYRRLKWPSKLTGMYDWPCRCCGFSGTSPSYVTAL
jgi:hypothetical protein